VEGCRSHGHAGLGLHPGSGSQRSILRNNVLRDNAIGIFFCWGVKSAVAEGNTIEDCRQSGISIGHRDTDNLIRKNTVRRSGQVGVLFRPEQGPGFAPHRNRLEDNRIEDSGPEEGVGIDVQGFSEGVTITGNEIRESRGPAKRIGIRVSATTGSLTLHGNRIEGVATPVADLRK
jgi:parallel beta-helix repeat protein